MIAVNIVTTYIVVNIVVVWESGAVSILRRRVAMLLHGFVAASR